MLTPDFVKLSHNGASDAQASVYVWVGVAIGVYVRAQVCKPGSTVAKMRRGSQILFKCFLVQTPAIVCFQRKNNICIAKFGNLGAIGVKGSKFLVENVIFGIADPDLPIDYATFMELR